MMKYLQYILILSNFIPTFQNSVKQRLNENENKFDENIIDFTNAEGLADVYNGDKVFKSNTVFIEENEELETKVGVVPTNNEMKKADQNVKLKDEKDEEKIPSNNVIMIYDRESGGSPKRRCLVTFISGILGFFGLGKKCNTECKQTKVVNTIIPGTVTGNVTINAQRSKNEMRVKNRGKEDEMRVKNRSKEDEMRVKTRSNENEMKVKNINKGDEVGVRNRSKEDDMKIKSRSKEDEIRVKMLRDLLETYLYKRQDHY
ncbi:uncharacterized protein LOC121738094 [Aricia agestis]|uniref:uncharacterized protein LOC121738094 n=1 Tax=Aricia agestis TaxID=91739 RepID=UPI001C207828|nr:uncharacterized protein LOC121738094 [Aricia agestis]